MPGEAHPAVDRTNGPYRKATSRQALGPDVLSRYQRELDEHIAKLERAATDPRQNHRTKQWAIASNEGISIGEGAAVEYAWFELVNRETGLAHELHFFGAGIEASVIPFVGFSTPIGRTRYATFATPRPMNFADFSNRPARLTTASAALGAWSKLTIWDRNVLRSDPIVYVSITGLEINTPGLSSSEGRTRIRLSTGARSGVLPLVLNTEPKMPPRPPPPTSVQLPAMENELIDIPNETLFDFDSAELLPTVSEALIHVGDELNNRRDGPVDIEGHTDAIGDPGHNMELSRRRAEAVQQWFVDAGVRGAETFRIKPFGETQPQAPNTRPDGSDNPEGRARNRRVSVRAPWRL